MASSPESVTQLLVEWRNGDDAALDKLVPLVYEELRRLAHYYRGRGQASHKLQTTALVNEAYVRLVDHKGVRWQNRPQFYAVAACAMRRVLVDHALSRGYTSQVGGARRVEIDGAIAAAEKQAANLIALDGALTELAAIDPRKSRVVEMRYFGGMSMEETARALGESPATIMSDWATAKAWLLRAISNREGAEDSSDKLIGTRNESRLNG